MKTTETIETSEVKTLKTLESLKEQFATLFPAKTEKTAKIEKKNKLQIAEFKKDVTVLSHKNSEYQILEVNTELKTIVLLRKIKGNLSNDKSDLKFYTFENAPKYFKRKEEEIA